MMRVNAWKRIVALLLVAVCLFSLPLGAFASNLFKNPVIAEDGEDPFVMEDGGWYYMYVPNMVKSGGVIVGGKVVAYKSQNLIDWTLIGDVYSNVGQTHDGKAVRNLWAPEVHKVNGVYYLYCVYLTDDAGLEDKDIVVIEGDSPTSFDASMRTMLLGADSVNLYLYLDPTFFKDADGSMYLYYKRRTGPGSSLFVHPMSSPTTLTGTATELLKSNNVTDSYGILEHPMMIKKGSNYLFFYSYGVGEETTYQIGYATSTSPTGPFAQSSSNPIMYTNQTAGVISPGAASIVKDGAGNDWIAYRQKLNSATGWSRVETVNRINLDSSGQVSVIPTRNTYVTKPVPLGSTSLPAGPTFTKVENTSSRIHYSGTWTVDSNASDSGGSVSFSGVSGDSAELQFYGTAARVAVRTGINSGIADVKLDGVVVVNNVDTYSTPALYKQIIYEIEGLTEGTHTVSFQPNGTKNALSGMTSARLDYFEYVGPNAVDSSSGSLTYSGSGWGVFNLASDYGGSVKSSQVTGDFMQITLTGTNVKLFARKGPAAGKVDVYLDGVLVKNDFDLYSSSTVSQVLVYDSGTISSGSHTVKYVVTGLKNSSSTGYGNNFDFLVYK